MSSELHIIQDRTCGECTMCCKLLTIRELDKPAGEWCKSAHPGKGCGIYATRPQVCREFECMWLQEDSMPEELRPDKSHVILWVNETGEILFVTVDPLYPDAYKVGEMKRCLDNILLETPNPKVGVIVGNNKFPLFPEYGLNHIEGDTWQIQYENPRGNDEHILPS